MVALEPPAPRRGRGRDARRAPRRGRPACRPYGQVRLDGELWRALCADGADPDDHVVIEAVEGLTLVVVPDRGA